MVVEIGIMIEIEMVDGAYEEDHLHSVQEADHLLVVIRGNLKVVMIAIQNVIVINNLK